MMGFEEVGWEYICIFFQGGFWVGDVLGFGTVGIYAGFHGSRLVYRCLEIGWRWSLFIILSSTCGLGLERWIMGSGVVDIMRDS